MGLARDIRFALRQLRKTPGFTLTIVLTLTLGLAATTVVFSLVEGILLRPLPFQDPGRLVLLGDHVGEGPGISVTPREVAIYSESAAAFSSIGGFATAAYELSGGAVPEVVDGARVSASTLPTLGVQPMLGRFFTHQEEQSRQPMAVIGYGLWTARFHRDPNVLGQSLTLNRTAYTIIGVMPRSFEFPLTPGRLDQVQLWVPLSLTPDELSDSFAGHWGFNLVARLKDGVTLDAAARDADRVAKKVMLGFPPTMKTLRIRGDVMPLLESTVGDARSLLRTLFVAVCVVLLIVCLNVAILLLVRAIRRRREYAVRVAVGARTGAVLRQSLCEGLCLSLSGGALGLLLAWISLPLTLRYLPDSLPRIEAVALNFRVAAFALLLAVVTGIFSSVAPAFAALRTNLLETLKQSSPTGTHGSSHTWLRSALVVAEITIALMLLTASVAVLRSYQKMTSVDSGFQPDRVLVASFQLPESQYASNATVENFNRNVLDRLSAQPGTLAAGVANAIPTAGERPMASYTVEGTTSSEWKLQFAEFSCVYGDYFHALGIPLLSGRSFTRDDREDTPFVAIVNRSMARHWWPNEPAIGKRLHIGNPAHPLPWVTIVGVVGDTLSGSRDEPANEQLYFPLLQPDILTGKPSAVARHYTNSGYLVLRSELPPELLLRTLRATIAAVDPQLALSDVRTMNEAVANVESPRRFNASLISIFGAAALLLAMIGIYAVVAFSVSIRDQEIAIRMALGAQRESVARLVLGWGARMAVIGCLLGVVGSLALSRIVQSLLFEVSAMDPLIYVGSVALMLLLACAASAIPALRAASADPVRSLRIS